jgi:hypothetical protein
MTATVYLPMFENYVESFPDLQELGLFYNEKDAVHAILEFLCDNDWLTKEEESDKEESDKEESDDKDNEDISYEYILEQLSKKNIQMETEKDLNNFLSDTFEYGPWNIYIFQHTIEINSLNLNPPKKLKKPKKTKKPKITVEPTSC